MDRNNLPNSFLTYSVERVNFLRFRKILHHLLNTCSSIETLHIQLKGKGKSYNLSSFEIARNTSSIILLSMLASGAICGPSPTLEKFLPTLIKRKYTVTNQTT